MDIADLLATMRKPLVGDEVHYVPEPGTCQPVTINSVEQDDIFLALDTWADAPLEHVMLDGRFGYWDCDFRSYRRETWHWPRDCRH